MAKTSQEIHKSDYEMHAYVVQAECKLRSAYYIADRDLIPYEPEDSLNQRWGVRYVKGSSVVWLNRFTAETIIALL